MNNRIIHISQIRSGISNEKQSDKNTLFVELDGKAIQDEETFIKELLLAFKYPWNNPVLKIGWLTDYMKDLLWIDQRNIVLIIRHYNSMLITNPYLKRRIEDEFQDVVLPWWEYEVVGHMVDGFTRGFIVYLVDD